MATGLDRTKEEDVELNIPEDNVLFQPSSYGSEVRKAHEAFVAQLAHTMKLIKQLEEHPHFSDDCGEYLAHALELSTKLQAARQDGPEALYDEMVKMLEPSEEDPEISDIMQYSTDGMSAQLNQWALDHGAKDGGY